jgi:hypothetical protein
MVLWLGTAEEIKRAPCFAGDFSRESPTSRRPFTLPSSTKRSILSSSTCYVADRVSLSRKHEMFNLKGIVADGPAHPVYAPTILLLRDHPHLLTVPYIFLLGGKVLGCGCRPLQAKVMSSHSFFNLLGTYTVGSPQT